MNDDLLSHAEDKGCDLKLVIDVSMRWNSKLRILKNILSLEPALQDFLKSPNRNQNEVFASREDDVDSSRKIISALEVLVTAVEGLFLEDVTDGIFRPLAQSIEQMILQIHWKTTSRNKRIVLRCEIPSSSVLVGLI